MTTLVQETLDLSADTARDLTDEVKVDVETLWGKFLRLYRGNAHLALGYMSWAEYCQREFEFGRAHAYRMLNAAVVAEVLEESPNGDQPITEAVARELAPLRDDPDELRQTWEDAVTSHGPTPTAGQVRTARETRRPARQPAPVREPPGDPDRDTRFDVIEDAVELLQLLPSPEQCVFPEGKGDVEALEQAFAWLAEWTPQIAKAWKAHRAFLRQRDKA